MLSRKLATFAAAILCLAIMLTAGCTEPARTAEKALLSVDFQPETPLRYKFISDRNVTLDWNPNTKDKVSKKKYTEFAEMIIAYEPVELNPYGLTKVKATFENIKTRKSDAAKKEPFEYLQGKSFTFTIGPNGKIHDNSDMFELLRETSKHAFRTGKGDQRIKDPDLLDDAIAAQLMIWDAPASIEKPAKGLTVGQSWQSRLFIPTSMIIREGLDVNYTLEEIRQTENSKTAVIKTSFKATQDNPNVPFPYEGQFQLAGSFGFFRSMFKGLSVKNAEGVGQQFFDIDSGRIKSAEQNYTAILKPNATPMPGTDPVIIIEQKTTIELIED